MTESFSDRHVYRFGEFELSPGERRLTRDGERVALTPRAFDLLVALVESDGYLLSKDFLMDKIWADAAVEEGNLNRTISALRKALGEAKGEKRFIETVPKAGYRFVAEVVRAGSSLESEIPDPRFQIPNVKFQISDSESQISDSVSQTSDLNFQTSDLKFEISDLRFQYEDREGTPKGLQVVDAAPLTIDRYRKFKWGRIAAIAAVLFIFGSLTVAYFIFRDGSAPVAATSVNDGPLRLTTSRYDEDGAAWTKDGRIRLVRFTNPRGESFIIKPDGSGEQRETPPIKDFVNGNWSPDGRRVIFTKVGVPGYEIYLARADGTNEIKLPFRIGPGAWSDDSAQYVFNNHAPGTTNSEIFVYEIEAGKLTQITNDPAFDANPSFSPDGAQIVFNSTRGGKALNIYLMNADGSNVRRLTDHPTDEPFPVFTPDGTQILFTSRRENEKVGIYLINVNDDQPPIKISDTRYNAETRSRPFSPDGTKIVFTSDREGDKMNTYVMNFEPFKPTLLLSSETRDVQAPSFFPNGKQIVYQAKLPDKSGELCIFDIETQETKVLLKSENSDLSPRFSPDGGLIAFNCKIGGNTEVCTVRPDGSNLQNLTGNPARDSDPTWSPDGREIIFASNRDGTLERHWLYRMNADGRDQRRVTQGDGWEITPAWSPDGSLLAFAGDRADGKSRALDIFLIDLANPAEERILAVRRFHDVNPAFSPDGKHLAFVNRSDGNAEIYLMNSDGSGLLRLTHNAGDDTTPQFSRDGGKIIFSSNRSGKFALYQINLP